MTWDPTSPLGSDFISLGDDEIRELKTDIQTSLRANAATGTEAIFPGSDTANPVFRYRGLKGTTGARPASGQYGLYINETLNTIQRDNGSAWQDVATLIPSGTKMPFYQASPPVGWTAVAVNDKFMRVVTSAGTGGTNGGSGSTPSSGASMAHTHTVASHTHTGPSHTHSTPNHSHNLSAGASGTQTGATADVVYANSALGGELKVAGGTPTASGPAVNGATESSGAGTTGAEGTGATGASSPATDSQLTTLAFQYADFCVGTKD